MKDNNNNNNGYYSYFIYYYWHNSNNYNMFNKKYDYILIILMNFNSFPPTKGIITKNN